MLKAATTSLALAASLFFVPLHSAAEAAPALVGPVSQPASSSDIHKVAVGPARVADRLRRRGYYRVSVTDYAAPYYYAYACRKAGRYHLTLNGNGGIIRRARVGSCVAPGGGVNVRAPYTGVNVGRGGVGVRAPGVNIFIPR